MCGGCKGAAPVDRSCEAPNVRSVLQQRTLTLSRHESYYGVPGNVRSRTFNTVDRRTPRPAYSYPDSKMKLACVRCKRKKIKCDKGEPVCHQCVTAKADCQYVERRQRPKTAQQRVAVQHLNQRLEFLEKQISRGGSERSPTIPTSPDAEGLSETVTSEDSVPSPKVSLMGGDGQESWIYRMASDVRRNFQEQNTPVSTPTLRIDDAMSSLNEALDELGKLRIRTKASEIDLSLSPEEVKACTMS